MDCRRIIRCGCRPAEWMQLLVLLLFFTEESSGFVVDARSPLARRPQQINTNTNIDNYNYNYNYNHIRADLRLGLGTTPTTTPESAEERQDAYGRSLPVDNDSAASREDDPLRSCSTTTTTTTEDDDESSSPPPSMSMSMSNSMSINLDPLVVCGPSGVGKGTVIESLRKRFPPNVFGFSVSHTTRQPRPGEIHGEHYFFTTKDEMREEIAAGGFVEHATVHGNYYGTSKESIAVLQEAGKITILDIDVQGVESVKESLQQQQQQGRVQAQAAARYVFIAPPSMDELEKRLRGRGTETEEAIAKRLSNAAKEMEYGAEERGNFDRVFVNHDVERTVDEMVAVLSEWYPQLTKFRNENDDDDDSDDASSASSSPVAAEETKTKTEPGPNPKEEATKKEQEEKSPPKQKEPWDFVAESDKMISDPSVPKPDFGTPQLKRFRDVSSLTSAEKAKPSRDAQANKKEKQTQKQTPPPPPPEEKPWDFLAESDKMMRFGSVREGHDKLEVSDRPPVQPMQQQTEKHTTKYGPYTVDNEEPDWPHPSSYRDFGETNPNIVLDAKEDEE